MQKPLKVKPKGGLRKNLITRILPQTAQNGNSTNSECQIFTFIARHELTNALECLEYYGFSGDTGTFMLGYLQREVTP